MKRNYTTEVALAHLPECPVRVRDDGMRFYPNADDAGYGSEDCWVCDALRACEQRVLNLNPAAHDVLIAQRARERALDAAREAVNRVASNMANWTSAETALATRAFPDLSHDQWMWAQRGVRRALAAIDALRKRSGR